MDKGFNRKICSFLQIGNKNTGAILTNMDCYCSGRKLTLYSDRISHPVRACLLFLKANGIDFKEETVSILRGVHFNHPQLPTKRLPTLELCEENGGKPDPTKMVLCQSTTILRFLATNFCNESSWYTDPKIRFKIDEFLDFFQVCN